MWRPTGWYLFDWFPLHIVCNSQKESRAIEHCQMLDSKHNQENYVFYECSFALVDWCARSLDVCRHFRLYFSILHAHGRPPAVWWYENSDIPHWQTQRNLECVPCKAYPHDFIFLNHFTEKWFKHMESIKKDRLITHASKISRNLWEPSPSL